MISHFHTYTLAYKLGIPALRPSFYDTHGAFAALLLTTINVDVIWHFIAFIFRLKKKKVLV